MINFSIVIMGLYHNSSGTMKGEMDLLSPIGPTARNDLMNYALIMGALLGSVIPLLLTGVYPGEIMLLAAWIGWFNFLPGWGLLGLAGKSRISAYQVILALVVGVAASIFLYIISLLLANFWWYIILSSLLALLGIYYLAKNYGINEKWGDSDPEITWPDVILLVGLLVMVNIIIYFSYYGTSPLPGDREILYFLDIPWHLGNIASLSAGWFPQDFRLAGYSFHYHFFSYAWMAAVKRTCGFTGSVILLRLFPAFFFNLLFFAMWTTGRALFSKRTAYLAIFITLLAGNFIVFKPHNLLLNNLMFSPTYLLAMVLFWPLAAEIVKYLESATEQIRFASADNRFAVTTEPRRSVATTNYHKVASLLIIGLLMAALAGTKATFLPVVVAGVLLVAALVKESRTAAIILAVLGIVTFLCFYLWLYRGGGASDLTISVYKLVYDTEIYKHSLAWLTVRGFRGAGVLAIFIYFLGYLGIKLGGLVYGMAQALERKRPDVYVFLLGITLAGVMGGYLLQARDNSQYYFLFAGLAALNLLTASYLDNIYINKVNIRDKVINVLIIIILLLPSVVDTMQMVEKNRHDGQVRGQMLNKPLTPGLYAGLTFLREHSSPEAVVVGRRFSEMGGRRIWFYYSAFSERRMLLEGWEFMPRSRFPAVQDRYQDIVLLYKTTSPLTARKILNQYGIDYLIADKKYRSTQPHFPLPGILRSVFDNEKVTIYQVQK